jgi:hypothetical protein
VRHRKKAGNIGGPYVDRDVAWLADEDWSGGPGVNLEAAGVENGQGSNDYRRGFPTPFQPYQKAFVPSPPPRPSPANISRRAPFQWDSGIEATTTLTTTHHGSPQNSLSGPGIYYPFPAPILDLQYIRYPPYQIPAVQSRGVPYYYAVPISHDYEEAPEDY